MVSLSITIDPAKLAEAKASLSADEFRRATYNAVKRATESGVTRVNALIRAVAYLKKEAVSEVIKSRPPKGEPPVGTITISRKPVPMEDYRHTELKKGGVRVYFTKDKPPVTLLHAFETVMPSGHRGVFERTKRPAGKSKVNARGITGRLHIKEDFGPSIVDLVNVPVMFKQVEDELQEILNKRMDSQIDRFLHRSKADSE